MSFILDALKKAESERNRNSGPVLMDVRIAPPRRRLPTWAWVLGGVLAADLVVLAWLLQRSPADTAPVAAPAQAPAPPPTAPSATPPAAVTPLAPAPAVDISATPAALPGIAAPPAIDVDRLPTSQDLLAAGVALPPLQLNLHVYNELPARRYVLLNGLRLTEGEFTPDGVKVEAIVTRGVVLEAGGRRFLLPAGG